MEASHHDHYSPQPPQGVRPLIKDEEYNDLQPYIDSAKALARITYKSLYIIDYNRMNFLYISDNPLFLCGERVENAYQEGFNFYYQRIPKEDHEFLSQVNRISSVFLRGIPTTERTQYVISYNFRITQKHAREKILLNHQVTPLKLDSMGNVWLALCIVSLAPTQEIGVAFMTKINSDMRWKFSLNSERWEQIDKIELNEFEKKVIRLANQGLSVNQIAEEIKRSKDSVKCYRKSLFLKLGVSKISEAIAIATHHKLI